MPQTLCRRLCAAILAVLAISSAGMTLLAGGSDAARATAIDQHAHWLEPG